MTTFARPVRRGGPAVPGFRSVVATALVYRWELLKLRAQKRTYLGLGAAVGIPLVFVGVLLVKSGGPNDVPARLFGPEPSSSCADSSADCT